MFAIYKKELRSYFTNPHGYVFAGIFLALSALVFSYTTLLMQSYDTTLYFTVMVFALVVLVPLLTMRLFTEEKKLRTEQLLLTAPVTITGMVLGKFLAAFTLFFS
ncbi:MAG: ABC transporter, partial [Clostridia bacterium]|nr:ABC transporter [Clostridia bacterium]